MGINRGTLNLNCLVLKAARPRPTMFQRIPSLGRPLKAALWPHRGTVTIAPLVTGLVLVLRGLGLLQPLELALFDSLMRSRPASARDDRVMIVEVNETDLQQLKRWPIDDRTLAQGLGKIRQGQPAAIGLDLYRDYALEPGHRELTTLFQTTPNLIGITKQNAPQDWQRVPPAPALAAVEQIGVNDVVIDRDGRLRRALLYFSTPDGTTYESLGLRVALTYLEGRGISPQPDTEFLTLNRTEFAPFEPDDGPYVGADALGTQIWLNYRGGDRHFQRVSLADVLADRVPASTFTGRVVLIGVTAVSLRDSFLTPYSQGSGDQPLELPGVEFHANVVSDVLSRVLDARSGIRSGSESQEILWIALWGLLGTGLAWRWRFVRQRQWLRLLLLLAIVLVALPIGHYCAFVTGLWVPLLPALLSYAGGMGLVLVHTAYRAGEIRQTFGRYLSDEVVSQLLESPQARQIGGDRREVTMLIADLRGFSAIAEQYAPEQVMRLLNHYLARMTDVIGQYQGTIDELMGDSILVMFGAPTARVDDVDRAVACALAMQLAMPHLSDGLEADLAAQMTQLQMGIALHCGEVVVGNIGSMKRAKYGMVGSQINLTARIESYTVGGQILISDSLAQRIAAPIQLGQSFEIRAKGFAAPVQVHELQAIGGEQAQSLPVVDERLVTLAPPLAIDWTTLKAKQVQHPMLAGQLTQLAPQFAVIRIAQSLELLSDLKLNLPEAADVTTDVYAKVIGELPPDPHHPELKQYRLRFTFMPLGVQQAIATHLATTAESDRLRPHPPARQRQG
jgi:adenylate cyclase